MHASTTQPFLAHAHHASKLPASDVDIEAIDVEAIDIKDEKDLMALRTKRTGKDKTNESAEEILLA